MRLIDADALEQEISAIWDIGFTPEKVSEKIRKAPTVDAVPVVRCKDCKWRGTAGCVVYGEEQVWDTDNEFCSYGERE